jgi:hypothetical protein
LSPWAKVRAEALKQSYPDMPEAEIEDLAKAAAEQARERFGKMMEEGADPWVVSEQLLAELSEAPPPKERP